MRSWWVTAGRSVMGGVVVSALAGVIIGIGGVVVAAEEARIAAVASLTGACAGTAWTLLPVSLALRRRYVTGWPWLPLPCNDGGRETTRRIGRYVPIRTAWVATRLDRGQGAEPYSPDRIFNV